MELAVLIASFLSPFLPHLVDLGKPVAEEAGKVLGTKIGENSWEQAKKVWGKLSPQLTASPLATGATQALSQDSEDQDARDVLTKQLDKILSSNPALAEELERVLQRNTGAIEKSVNIHQQVRGDKNITIGDASGSISIQQQ